MITAMYERSDLNRHSSFEPRDLLALRLSLPRLDAFALLARFWVGTMLSRPKRLARDRAQPGLRDNGVVSMG
jgi:hypothetical protein